MYQHYLLPLFCLLQIPALLLAEDPDDSRIWRNEVYQKGIKTVIFKKNGVENSTPVLKLGGSTKLKLSFDKLSHKVADYKFTIQHCTPDWRASDLSTSQYIDGINSGFINNYDHSFNTYHDYVHYWFTFPTRNMKPKIPGNYILKVYKSGNKENLILTRRFFVVENKVSTEGEVKRATFVRYRDYKHEVDFQINYQNLSKVSNPLREFLVVIRQNERWDNAIVGLKPSYVQGKKLIYDYDEKNLFNAGNEFRTFDITSLKQARRGVKTLKLDSFYQAHLLKDEDRSFKSHTTHDDLNGSRIIHSKSGQKPQLQADYVSVNFYLKANLALEENQGIFVFGGLSDWMVRDKFQMKFYPEQKVYHQSVLLKQGYYDYKYVVASNYGENINARKIEGSHYETENDYTIFVYFRSPFLNTYKLVGLERLNSGIVDD